MAYDISTESLRLIEHGLPDHPVTISRRHRFAPLAVDVNGHVAATRFLRRGAGCLWDDIHILSRTPDGPWQLHGGGGGSSPGPWSAFLQARTALPPHHVEPESGAGVQADVWISSAALLAAPDVTTVRVDGRVLPVPAHGRLVVVWSSADPPAAEAYNSAGEKVAIVRL